MSIKAVPFVLSCLLVLSGTAAHAEPVGEWFSGYGQGITEYAIENDSAQSDYFYIACSDEGDATIMFTVAKKEPGPNSSLSVAIGDQNYDLAVGEDKLFHTDTKKASDDFRSLWNAIRTSSGSMQVRLPTGEAASFTLKGAAKVLTEEPCTTAFEKK